VPGAAKPAEHGAATSPDSVRLSEEAAGQLHRPPARRNGATATARTGAYSGEPWFEWEERHGPEPASTASRPNDDVVLQVCFVETTRLHGCNDNLSARAILESAHSPP
jgi:hypothetical protein